METKKICHKPFYYAEIYSTGDVYPCCPAFCNYYSLGNIFDETLDEIWNGKKAIEFRQKMKNSDYSLCDLKKCRPDYYDHPEISEEHANTIVACYEEECNVACVICRDKIKRNSIEDEKKCELVTRQIGDSFKYCQTFYLSGSSDPFGSRYCRKLMKFVSANYKNVKFDLITNGVLCSKPMCNALGITDKLNMIAISLHAATEETYNKIVKYGNFNKIMKNIEWITEIRKDHPFAFQLLFVVHDLNYHEIPAFIKFAKKVQAVAVFSQYRNIQRGIEFEKNADEHFVFFEAHKDYWKFLKIMGDSEVHSENCIFDGYFNEIIHLKYLRLRVIKFRILSFMRRLLGKFN